MEADTTAIKEVLGQYEASCNSGDFDLWITLLATYVPARRAARVDPLIALGSE